MPKINKKILCNLSWLIFLFPSVALGQQFDLPIRIMSENRPVERQLAPETVQTIVIHSLQADLETDRYLAIDVFIVDGESTNSPVILAYLKYRYSFGLQIVRITLDNKHQVRLVESDVDLTAAELQSAASRQAACPDESIEAVFATPLNKSPMVPNINKAANAAKQAGYSTKVLTGGQASVGAYKNWLACKKLVFFGNISHGNTSSIILDDGRLTSAYFSSLPKGSLLNKILFFNSCQVHNEPLDSAIVGTSVAAYIGGNVNLKVGVAGDVFTTFWSDVLKNKPNELEPTLRKLEDQLYGSRNAYGISGNEELPWTVVQPEDNTKPVAKSQSLTTSEDTAISVKLNASDADADPLTLRIIADPAHGFLSGSGQDRVYTPKSGFSGTDSFTFVANDGLVDSNAATVSIAIEEVLETNQAPVAHDQHITTSQGTSKTIRLVASDGNGDELTYHIVDNPEHGTLLGFIPDLIYQPNEDFVGQDSFTFKVSAQQSDSNVATVLVDIVSQDTVDTPVLGCATGSKTRSLQTLCVVIILLLPVYRRRSWAHG